jgi:hypothetical protein
MAVTFDAMLGGCAGFMSILWIDGGPCELLSRKPVELAEPGPEGGDA